MEGKITEKYIQLGKRKLVREIGTGRFEESRVREIVPHFTARLAENQNNLLTTFFTWASLYTQTVSVEYLFRKPSYSLQIFHLNVTKK